MELLDTLLSLVLFIVPLAHLITAPYTKVEESFPIQATHDILVYGTPTSNVNARLTSSYDHFTFPGAVARTFVGPVILAGISQPIVALVGFQYAQFIVRAVLGAFNAACLLVFARSLGKAFGKGPMRWWMVFMASQFHVNFYLSRTLPNMFAFGLTTLASAFLLPQADPRKTSNSQKQAIVLLTFSGVIFRSEIAILLLAVALQLLLTRSITVLTLIRVGLVSFVLALLVSVPVDCYFWQKPVWPELWGFYYNAVLGSSSDWGVSPWWYYFTSAIPRLLLNPLAIPLILFSLLHPSISTQARSIALPSLAFVAVYSLQPHKETRFIFYAVPCLTAAAALGANFFSTRMDKRSPPSSSKKTSPTPSSTMPYRLITFLLAASALACFAASSAMLLLSSLNYPGGEAVSQLYALTDAGTAASVSVHADVLTCMTGLTRFGQNPQGHPLLPAAGGTVLLPTSLRKPSSSSLLVIDKTEDAAALASPKFWSSFDFALLEDPAVALGEDWIAVGVVLGYSGIELLTPESAPVLAFNAAKGTSNPPVLGKGADILAVRDWATRYTGGWWIGPRMSPQIYILKQEPHTSAAIPASSS